MEPPRWTATAGPGESCLRERALRIDTDAPNPARAALQALRTLRVGTAKAVAERWRVAVFEGDSPAPCVLFELRGAERPQLCVLYARTARPDGPPETRLRRRARRVLRHEAARSRADRAARAAARRDAVARAWLSASAAFFGLGLPVGAGFYLALAAAAAACAGGIHLVDAAANRRAAWAAARDPEKLLAARRRAGRDIFLEGRRGLDSSDAPACVPDLPHPYCLDLKVGEDAPLAVGGVGDLGGRRAAEGAAAFREAAASDNAVRVFFRAG